MDFLEVKIRLPDSKVIEEVNRLGLNKMSFKRKGEKITDRLNKSVKNHKKN